MTYPDEPYGRGKEDGGRPTDNNKINAKYSFKNYKPFNYDHDTVTTCKVIKDEVLRQ